jgi:hypothetical protein
MKYGVLEVLIFKELSYIGVMGCWGVGEVGWRPSGR